jgi:membrane protease YdiL (CAAX protease family)
LRVWDRSTRVWDRSAAILFALSVCFVYWALSIAASFGPDFTITVHPLQFAIDTRFILLMAASFLPALYCFAAYPECRSSLEKVNTSWKVYFVAIAAGFIPVLSYFGSHYPAFPWGRPVAVHLARAFANNLFLSPLWEEIIWRGCFLRKVRSFSSASSGILLMSVGWTIWHGGYIAFLMSGGVPIKVLSVLPFTYFFSGILLGSVFEMGRGSLWPCVLLHSALNATTAIYYSGFNRASELGSYVSELTFMAIVAAIVFIIAVRSGRCAGPSSALSAV